jgi:hypothetical protein
MKMYNYISEMFLFVWKGGHSSPSCTEQGKHGCIIEELV